MYSSGDAAETIVKMSLESTEVALKITGSAAKNVTAILLALSKNKIKTKGKTSLSNMLKSGKELKVFSLKQVDLKKFVKTAKKYGVLYHVLIDKQQSKKDGMVDILVRSEDAAKINRIFERFNFSLLDKATVSIKDKKAKEKSDIVVDDILSMGRDKINKQEESNLVKETSEKDLPSDISSIFLKEGNKKPSIKEKLKKIKRKMVSKKVVKKHKQQKKLKNPGDKTR